MQIIITGGGGFLGQRLAKVLLASDLAFDELLLVDIVMPGLPSQDIRLRCRQADLAEPGAAESLVTPQTGLIFHLAAIVSSHAEADFDLGYRVNVDITKSLLDVCRHTGRSIRFVFASSLAVYGGTLPAEVGDGTVVTPRSSYGTQKAMGELLVNDYSRKGFVEGLVLRLPTVCVRPGKPNRAASSFVSSIIREPLQGQMTICPVSADLSLWLSSPDTVVQNLLHAATLEFGTVGDWRTVNLPGIGVTVQQMLDALLRHSNPQTLTRIRFERDEAIQRIVSSWPGRMDNSRALALGFRADENFDDFIEQFTANDMQQTR